MQYHQIEKCFNPIHLNDWMNISTHLSITYEYLCKEQKKTKQTNNFLFILDNPYLLLHTSVTYLTNFNEFVSTECPYFKTQ